MKKKDESADFSIYNEFHIWIDEIHPGGGALAFIIFEDDILAFPEPTMWLHCLCGRQHCMAIATSSATIKNGEGISS